MKITTDGQWPFVLACLISVFIFALVFHFIGIDVRKGNSYRARMIEKHRYWESLGLTPEKPEWMKAIERKGEGE